MTIYIDAEYKCYIEEAEDRIPIETDFFDGKCQEFIEGYRYIPAGEVWTREDGIQFTGVMITPWQSYGYLANIQLAYEIEQYEKTLAEIENLLNL